MLSIVPTPLGNLQDITERSLEALKKADVIYCEDTRRSRQLLTHFGISAPLFRYDEHNPRSVGGALDQLRQGRRVALVSDGGTPVISDPGRRLVALARKEGLPVESLPGPSAVAAAVAGSGLPADSFIFLGFLPRSQGKQRKILAEAGALGRTLVLYESPFRVAELLQLAAEVFGPQAQAVLVRELSKVHEEWLPGTAAEVAAKLKSRDKILGECVVVLHPQPDPESSGP